MSVVEGSSFVEGLSQSFTLAKLTVPLFLAVFGLRFRLLTTDGAAAAVVVGLSTALAGWDAAGMLIAFFLLGSAATKFKAARKEAMDPFAAPPPSGLRRHRGREEEEEEEEGESKSKSHSDAKKGRVAAQVFGTAGLPALLCMASFLPGCPSDWKTAYLAFMATNTADTLASELGMLSRHAPRLVLPPFRVVPPGTDGAVSMLGFAVSALGGSIIGSFAITLDAGSMGISKPLVAGAVFGLLGSLLDSVLGAVFQAKSFLKAHQAVLSKKADAPAKPAGSLPTASDAAHWKRMNTLVNLVSSTATGIGCLYLARMFPTMLQPYQ